MTNLNKGGFEFWYTSYGWKCSPFTIKPDIKLVGLDEHKEKILNYISSKHLCLVVGDVGTGKTSLLKWVMKNLGSHKFIYLNAKEKSDIDFMAEIMEQRSILQKLFKKIPKNVVILLDESQKLQGKALDSLQILWDDNIIKSVVFCQPSSDLKQFTKSIEQRIGGRLIRLQPLKKLDVHKLIQIRTKNKHPFEEKAIDIITEHAKGVPRRILEYCELVCIEMQGAQNINAEDVKKVLKEQNKKELQFLEVEDAPEPLDKTGLSTQFSPMQVRIIKILMEGKKTTQQLSELLNTSGGSVGKQLNKLFHSQVVSIVNTRRPKVYDLNPEFKKELESK